MKYVMASLALIAVLMVYAIIRVTLLSENNWILVAVAGAIGGIVFRIVLNNWGRKKGG